MVRETNNWCNKKAKKKLWDHHNMRARSGQNYGWNCHHVYVPMYHVCRFVVDLVMYRMIFIQLNGIIFPLLIELWKILRFPSTYNNMSVNCYWYNSERNSYENIIIINIIITSERKVITVITYIYSTPHCTALHWVMICIWRLVVREGEREGGREELF